MGFLDYFFPRKAPDPAVAAIDLRGLRIDLGNFVVGNTALGSPPDERDPFTAFLKNWCLCKVPDDGFEIEVDVGNGVLKSLFLEMSSFRGCFSKNGEPILLNDSTSPDEIRELFGEPYWIDKRKTELLFFYEYQAGTVELQFEFPDHETLGILTLIQDGVLSHEEQRALYGVTKPWPPDSPLPVI